MSQQEPHWDRTQTLGGFGRHATTRPPATAAKAPALHVGAQVGRTGHLFEVDGGAESGQRVIKLLPWAAGCPPEVVSRFTRDAMTVANLRHPHIVQVAAAGTLADGTAFVLMERLAGETLEEATDGRPLPTGELLSILRGVVSALSAAHSVGVTHGELSAENIFMAKVAGYSHGFPKLLDFGVARLSAGAAVDAGDPRADQLALAALACRLLTGSSALADETTDPRCPPAYHVLARAMAPIPGQRFDSLSSFFQALQVALTSTGPDPVAPAVVRPAPPAVLAPTPRPAVFAPPAPLAPTAPQPSSLTQQFFAEGERQEQEQAQAQASAASVAPGAQPAAASANDSLALSGDFDRLPRRRAPILAAISLAVASAAIMGWTALALSRAHHPAVVPAAPGAPPIAALPDAKAAAPTLNRARPAAVHHPRATSVITRQVPAQTQPPPVAASNPRAPRPWAGQTAPTSTTPARAAEPSPAAAKPADPSDEDFTHPSEETEGEPVPGQPAEAAPEPAAPQAAP